MKSNTKNKTSKEFDSEELLKEYKKSLKTIRSLQDKIKNQTKQINQQPSNRSLMKTLTKNK